jgi:acetyl esterase/lipase
MMLRFVTLAALSLATLPACPADSNTSTATDAATTSTTTSTTDATTTTGGSATTVSTTADVPDPTTTTSTTTSEPGTTDATTTSTTDATASTTTGVVEGELGCAPADLFDFAPYAAGDCFCGDACDCFRDVPYGEGAIWAEPTLDDQQISQALDIYVPKGMSEMPAVLWAHPNGSSKEFAPDSGLAKNALTPAIAAGRVVVSVEFRHPVVNYDIGAPRTDLVDAIQFIRCNAPALGVDPTRLAGLASSRGTLMLWTAVQPELADPDSSEPVRRQSSRLLGVFATQAQTSYWAQWIADTFYAPELHPQVEAMLPADDIALGHAVGAVTEASPPVELAYVDPLAELPITAQTIGMVDPLHLPNFGDELCKAYAAAGHPQDCKVSYDVAQNTIFAGSVPFFAALFGD